MSNTHLNQIFNASNYLSWEQQQAERHEFVAGEIFAMTGASDAHATITLNLGALLRAHVRGSPCRAFVTDMKVWVETVDAFFYPDVFVTCDTLDREQTYYKSHPIIIIEVLSSSTAAYDRGRKFAYYRQLDSLQEYVLIDPETISVDCFRRDEQGHFVLYPFGPGDIVSVTSLEFTTPIEVLYEDVILASEHQAGD